MRLKVNHLIHDYASQRALNSISFELNENEMLCVLGPSGSGKSTLLRCLCGLLKPTSGNIEMNNQVKQVIDCADEKISLVFDEPHLIEHFTVYENIALGLKKRGVSQAETDKRVHRIAEQVQMSEYLFRKPASLSAGQMQRVAIARALVRDCELLLMDEAFSNLDPILKKTMIDLLLQLQKEYHFSCIVVTHSCLEAKRLQGKLMILNQGTIQQWDEFQICIDHPANDFVKNFLED